MTYEELKAAYEAAYEAAMQKCSELEKENDELKKSNEDQALHIEHLEEQILKRNKMLFGRSSEKSKFICDGQMDLDGNVFNEAEELSNLSAAEPTEESVTKKSKKTGKHRGRNELRNDLETREIVHTLPEDQRRCLVCGGTLVPFSKEYITYYNNIWSYKSMASQSWFTRTCYLGYNESSDWDNVHHQGTPRPYVRQLSMLSL